ncbi:unnamed protein product [Lampetra planeri]
MPFPDCTNYLNNSNSSAPSHHEPHRVHSAVFLVIVVAGLPGNFVALFVFLLGKKRRNAARCYCINLAAADLFYVLMLPFRIAFDFYDLNLLPSKSSLCQLCFYIFFVAMYSSVLFLTAININWYLAILQPTRQWKRTNVRQANVVSVVIWAFTALSSALVFLEDVAMPDHNGGCFDLQLLFELYGLSTVVGFIIPLGVIVFCSVSILHRMKVRSRNTGSQLRLELMKKIKAITTSVFTLFIVCFLPHHVIRLYYLHIYINAREDDAAACELAIRLEPYSRAISCLTVSHGLFNPVVYFYHSRRFRRFLRSKLPHVGKSVSRKPSVSIEWTDLTFHNSQYAGGPRVTIECAVAGPAEARHVVLISQEEDVEDDTELRE